MRHDLQLVQTQTLKLTMTQELRQAISLLQYSTLDLIPFLQEQALENPLLELKTQETYASSYQQRKGNSDSEFTIENVGYDKESIRDYIGAQILLDKTITKTKRNYVEKILPYLDDNGYFTESTSFIAQQMKVSEHTVDTLIQLVQGLEPAGVGARNLQECILLQLTRLPKRSRVAEEIIEEHFHLFAEKAWKTLSKQTGYSLKEIQEVSDLIVTLEPKPGIRYGSNDHAKYIIPDLYVTEINHEWIVSLNDELIPQIEINEIYANHLNGDDGRYIQEKIQHCHWLIRSLDYRKQTLIRVMEEIVRLQHSFFVNGPSFLKPLTLRVIAERLDVHESTVSRATKEKYVQTPYGLFELKYFFSQGYVTTLDEEKSSRQVKEVLQSIIEKEDKQKPYSDQKLTTLLKKEYSIDISRRTVAKYREQLQIPSSSQRKRYD
ncbi:RNA polymerase factor sigma-54 [Sutcliffiella cohnii]|uniref:RNA polymerase factor sigma-54 n=1 Tax=Sutcliffiella cohnii TaxID=33932 RepID=UPI002E1D7A24|nr:RNA polymerase factor sigma-54 [Sutcliffiella cohnii]